VPDGFSDPHFEQRISRSRVPQADLFKDAAVFAIIRFRQPRG
jgi:hypothetical protein